MTVERHFPGWDRPAVEVVRDYLIPHAPQGPVDLRTTLVLVPTRNAARRLREALTLYCARYDTHLMAPSLATPLQFLTASADDPVASPLDTAAIWADLLSSIDVSHFRGLFPSGTPAPDFSWALTTGLMLQSLRDEIAEHGESLRSLLQKHESAFMERERWDDLARLEALFLTRLEAEFSLRDPCESMLRRVDAPALPASVERVVLACNPDPTPITLLALDRLPSSIPVHILIHAPESLADTFDSWGRPLTHCWCDTAIDIEECDIRVASSPAAQSAIVLRLLAAEGCGPLDVALGVPDDSVIPYLEASLAERGIAAFNPAGAPLQQHPLFQLLSLYRDLVARGEYESLRAVMRNADMLDHLQRTAGITAPALLSQLDTFQNRHLPTSLMHLIERLSIATDEPSPAEYPALQTAVQAVHTLVQAGLADTPEAALRTFLRTVYSTRPLDPVRPEDREFHAAAESVDAALQLLSAGCLTRMGLNFDETAGLLLSHLGTLRYPLERPPDSVDLEGWLELGWNDAPLLILTGMNEGAVPQRQRNQAFLPESLRRALGLRSENERLARDIFLTTTLLQSRRTNGRVCFVSGKYGKDGEPLKPSRILLRCSDDRLPARARRLFGPPDDVRPSVPSTVSFTLRPSIPALLDTTVRIPSRLSVTSLRDYLNCPFRFYLTHILGMQALADTRREMDAADFGSLIHDVMARLARDEEMRCCTRVPLLQRFLDREVRRWADQRFGTSIPLHLRLQFDVARERLEAAATAQAQLASEGWEIVECEQEFQLPVGQMRVRGRIDRIDRHRETGRIRVLDYKTGDSGKAPEEYHLAAAQAQTPDYARVMTAGRLRRWADLQLPLYRRMLEQHESIADGIEAGYFNLPRETASAGVSLWNALTDELLRSADACAQGIITDIGARRFWPPSARVDFDDYESLFPMDITRCVDAASFTEFLESWRV